MLEVMMSRQIKLGDIYRFKQSGNRCRIQKIDLVHNKLHVMWLDEDAGSNVWRYNVFMERIDKGLIFLEHLYDGWNVEVDNHKGIVVIKKDLYYVNWNRMGMSCSYGDVKGFEKHAKDNNYKLSLPTYIGVDFGELETRVVAKLVEDKETKECTCEWNNVLRDGCKCGAIKRYKPRGD